MKKFVKENIIYMLKIYIQKNKIKLKLNKKI